MMFRRIGLSLVLVAGTAISVQAQSGQILRPQDNRSMVDRAWERKSPDNVVNHESSDEYTYQYPQSHEFNQPVIVGSDQLRSHTGYWQPGGYQVRDGSPFFNSVVGGPPRGPIAGGGGDSAGGSNYGGGYGMSGMSANFAGGYGGYAADGSMYGYGGGYGAESYGGMTGGGGAGGAGGDPYGYHFGPGYYRGGEYGHFRFPYYSYRRPWYFPGFAGYNRDVNLPW